MTAYDAETLLIAEERLSALKADVIVEVERLLRTGALDGENYSRGLVLGVAIKNVADKWLLGERRKADYHNLKHF